MATAVLLVTVALLAVFLRARTDPVALGLALSYGLQLNSVFQRCVQLAIEVGVYMTSVERYVVVCVRVCVCVCVCVCRSILPSVEGATAARACPPTCDLVSTFPCMFLVP
jgi:ABC-type proline/glycine betaine transport system permease subunit